MEQRSFAMFVFQANVTSTSGEKGKTAHNCFRWVKMFALKSHGKTSATELLLIATNISLWKIWEKKWNYESYRIIFIKDALSTQGRNRWNYPQNTGSCMPLTQNLNFRPNLKSAISIPGESCTRPQFLGSWNSKHTFCPHFQIFTGRPGDGRRQSVSQIKEVPAYQLRVFDLTIRKARIGSSSSEVRIERPEDRKNNGHQFEGGRGRKEIKS